MSLKHVDYRMCFRYIAQQLRIFSRKCNFFRLEKLLSHYEAIRGLVITGRTICHMFIYSLKFWKKPQYNLKLDINASFYICICSSTTSILDELTTWCFEHYGDISCSLLVNRSHTDESWAGRNTCMWICICIYIYIYIFNYLIKKHVFDFHKYFGCFTTVCMDKALYKKFTYTAEIKN